MSPLTSTLRLAHQAGALIRRSWRRAVHQERILATAIFALIASTAMTGLDYVVTGGAPDWNPVGEAYAQELHTTARPAQLATITKVDFPSATPALTQQADFRFTSEVLLGGPDEVFAQEDTGAVPVAFEPIMVKPAPPNAS